MAKWKPIATDALFLELAKKTGLTRKQTELFLAELTNLIAAQIRRGESNVVTLGDLVIIKPRNKRGAIVQKVRAEIAGEQITIDVSLVGTEREPRIVKAGKLIEGYKVLSGKAKDLGVVKKPGERGTSSGTSSGGPRKR